MSEFPEECIALMENIVKLRIDSVPYSHSVGDAVSTIASGYMKATTSESKEKAMDIIDGMYQKGYYSVRQLISALER